jgi:two-component system NtrC family sensor kinase
MSQWLRRPSLRRKVLGIILISGIVPALIVLVLANIGLGQVIDRGVSLVLMGHAEDVARKIDAALAEEIERMRALAEDPRLAPLIESARRRGAETPEPGLVDELRTENIVALIDLGGQHALSIDPETSLRNRIQDHLDEIGRRPSEVHLFEHRIGSLKEGWLILAAPVRDDTGALRGHLMRRLSMPLLMESALPRPLTDFQITVVNQFSQPVAGRELAPEQIALFDALLLQNPVAYEAWDVTETSGGTRLVLTMRQLRDLRVLRSEGLADTDWYVLIGYDIGPLLSELEFLLWRVGLMGLLAVAIFIGVGLLLTQRIIRPLRHLQGEVRQMSAGHLDRRIDIQTEDEIGDLATSVNIMAARLQGTYDDLAAKVRELRLRTDQLETLAAITRAVVAQIDREELLAAFENQLRRLVAFDALWVALVADKSDQIEIVRSPAPDQALTLGTRLPIAEARLGKAAAKRGVDVTADLRAVTESCVEDADLLAVGARALMVLPLVTQAGVIGTVGIGNRTPGQFSEAEVELIGQVCETLAIGIEHARLYRDLRGLADALEDKVAERTEALERAQRRLLQTERFAATGKLAANVAHEINNPLGIIKNYTRLVMDNLNAASGGRRDTDPNLENLTVITEEIDRIARIVRNLLNFYRTPASGPDGHRVQINDEIDAILRLAQRGLEKNSIRVQTELTDGLPTIEWSPDLIRQVFLNLIRNAEDAMRDRGGGELVIKTMLEERGDNRRIIATVRDTGRGIAPGDLEHIFDPFFTTKREESGTGLGLSVTYGIMTSLGGTVEVDTAVDKGSTFKLIFPLDF